MILLTVRRYCQEVVLRLKLFYLTLVTVILSVAIQILSKNYFSLFFNEKVGTFENKELIFKYYFNLLVYS